MSEKLTDAELEALATHKMTCTPLEVKMARELRAYRRAPAAPAVPVYHNETWWGPSFFDAPAAPATPAAIEGQGSGMVEVLQWGDSNRPGASRERITRQATPARDDLRTENERLRSAVLRDAKRRMTDLTEWLNADDANPILLRHAMDQSDLDTLRAALRDAGGTDGN